MPEILLIESPFVHELGQSEKNVLDRACSRIPGVKSRRREVAGRKDLFKIHKDTVFVVCLAIPEQRDRIGDWLEIITQSRPLPALCAFCFVIFPQEDFDPRQWIGEFWTDQLEKFGEIAVPSSFVVWGAEDSRLSTFRLVESLTSLCRELDTLAELRRLDEHMEAMEKQVLNLFRQTKRQ